MAAVLGVALLLPVALAGPAAASASENSDDATTFTTFGYIPTDGQGVASSTAVERQTARVEVFDTTTAQSLSADPDNEPIPLGDPDEFAAAAAADPAYRVVSTWTDKLGKTTVARAGNGTTWGLTKVKNKHNVTLGMVQKTTKFPREGGRVTSGNSITYMTDAIEWSCTIISCTPKRTMAVKVVIENTRLGDNYHKGLITAYCAGVTVCPQWVVNAAG